MPRAERAWSMVSLLKCGIVRLTMCGEATGGRFARTPERERYGLLASFSNRRSRSSVRRAILSARAEYPTAAALAKAAHDGGSSVPERSPASCPPPKRIGTSPRFRMTPGSIQSAPVPFGPSILWELKVSSPQPSVLTENGTFRYACVASTCRTASGHDRLSAAATAGTS